MGGWALRAESWASGVATLLRETGPPVTLGTELRTEQETTTSCELWTVSRWKHHCFRCPWSQPSASLVTSSHSNSYGRHVGVGGMDGGREGRMNLVRTVDSP